MASWVLAAMDLACQKAHRTLFQGVNFSVSEGSFLHIEGSHGCGKTSLLRILYGLSPAARGQVLWPFFSQSPISHPDRSVLHGIGHAPGLNCMGSPEGGLTVVQLAPIWARRIRAAGPGRLRRG